MNILKAAISWLLTKHVKKEQNKMSKIALAASADYVLMVTVTDDADVPVVGAGIVLTGDAGLGFAPNTLTTGDAGTATSTLSATAGAYTVTASLADGTTASTSVTFAAAATDAGSDTSTGIVATVESDTEAFIAALKKLVTAAGAQAHAVFDDLIELAKKLK